MEIKDLLLNGQSFLALLKEFAIEAKDIIIRDEKVLLADQNLVQREVGKETICIEGKNEKGIFNFLIPARLAVPAHLHVDFLSGP